MNLGLPRLRYRLQSRLKLSRRLKLWFATANLSIGAGRVDVMAETAIGVGTLLHDFQLAGQEDQSDLAAFRIGRLERGYIAVNDGFTHCVTHVWTLCQSHVDAVELHFQFIMTQSQNTKLALVIAIDTVSLRRSYNLMFLWRLGALRSSGEADRDAEQN